MLTGDAKDLFGNSSPRNCLEKYFGILCIILFLRNIFDKSLSFFLIMNGNQKGVIVISISKYFFSTTYEFYSISKSKTSK